MKKERERNRILKKKMKHVQREQNPDMYISSSDESDLDDDEANERDDPELRCLAVFEENLKKRIFLADRYEKVEKALVAMNLISKDVLFCSDFEFNRFKQALE